MHIAAILDVGLLILFMLLAWAELAAARGKDAEKPSDARLVTNFGLGILILSIGFWLPAAKIASSFVAQGEFPGLAELYYWPWAVALAVFLLVDSFAGYWVHRTLHTVPALWRLHRIHHADNSVDISTSLRSHPLELLIPLPLSVVVILAIGAPPSVVIVSQTITVAAAMFQHADLELPRLERFLGPWLITPATHRVHHSPDRATHDGNYGDFITLWDRLFGTFSRSKRRGRVGLEGQVARPDHLLEQILSPVYAPRRDRRSLNTSP